jgi:hypothetical protein
MLKEVNSLK